MESASVFVLILAIITFSGHAHCLNISASQNPIPVGSNVTLSSSDHVAIGAWQFNTGIIVFITEANSYVTDSWRDRVKFNRSTSSLTIMSLTLEDSGLYSLQVATGASLRADLNLSVQVAISNATLRAQATNLVEYNDTAVLKCSVSKGSSLSYTWLKGNSVVTTGGNVLISNGGAMLTIANVTRNDQGPFRCNVSNGISSEVSPPVHLNISYGPSNVTITVMPMEDLHKIGSNVTLSCSAESSPPAMIQWMFNGVNLNKFGPQLKLENVMRNSSGIYKCQLYNTVTKRFSSASAMIRILDPITNVQVEGQMNPAIEGHAYNLTCNVTGSVDHIYWMKKGVTLHEDNTTVFYMDNKTLMFNPLNRYDTGYYQCKASNAVGNMTSASYMLLVNYGPDTPIIEGPAYAETGHYAVFNCSTMSVPPSTYSWWYNNSMLANTSVLKIDQLSLNMSGEYTCKVYNKVTGKSNSSSKMLTVIEAIQSVMIKNNTIPINNENFTLTCEVVGPYDTIYWMMNNMTLSINSNATTSNMSYHIENNTLHFSPVTLYSDGAYRCVATNRAAHHKSPEYVLLVNYGPLSVTITGPNKAPVGVFVSLTCSADSRPEPEFAWFFYNISVPEVLNGSVLTFPVTLASTGQYMCIARNPVTNITMYQYKQFTTSGGLASTFPFTAQGSLMLMSLFALSAPMLFK